MNKDKQFDNVVFLPEHIKEIATAFRGKIEESDLKLVQSFMTVKHTTESWGHDNEDEFFSDIRSPLLVDYSYGLIRSPYYCLRVTCDRWSTRVSVQLSLRSDVEAVYNVVEKIAAELIKHNPPPAEIPIMSSSTKVFIGHGHDSQWRDLKDHLQDQHGISVETFESGARAGHAIRDVLQGMLNRSSIAFLVMTAENETTEGEMLARQNVIHEIGLFQGWLGFSKAIVLLEDGVQEFSNIYGINQIRFPKGSISSTYGDVLATIKRES
ncbi:MAG: TIR domain-containing protein [Armatimonadota bacterium]